MSKRFNNPLERRSAGTTAVVDSGVEMLAPTLLRLDGGTQMRGKLDEGVIAEYVEKLGDGQQPPAIDAIYDGTNYWVWDGFHRIAAHLRVHDEEAPMSARVQPGTQRDAVLAATGANGDHGLRRNAVTKQRSVDTLLLDPEWGKWGNREIARRTATTHPFVAKRRAALGQQRQQRGLFDDERVYKTRHGTVATMQTGKIGASLSANDLEEQYLTSVEGLSPGAIVEAIDLCLRDDEALRVLATDGEIFSGGRVTLKALRQALRSVHGKMQAKSPVTGNISSENGSPTPLSLDECIAVVWRTLKNGVRGLDATDDNRRLDWLRATEASGNLEAAFLTTCDEPQPDGRPSSWHGRPTDNDRIVYAWRTVESELRRRVAHAQRKAERHAAHSPVTDADVDAAGEPVILDDAGTLQDDPSLHPEQAPAALALPADLVALGWVVNEVAGTGLYYGYRPRDGERLARSTANSADWGEVVDLIRAVERADEPAQEALLDEEQVQDVDWNRPVTLTMSLGAVKAGNRMLYGLAAASVPKALLIELRSVYGEALGDAGGGDG